MKRISLFFSATIVAFALFGALISPSFAAGDGYQMVNPPQPTTVKDKDVVEVVEIFWYGCPHCYQLKPYEDRWLKKKPANVKYIRMPGMFRPSWEIHGRAYYTAEILNVVDKVHGPMFEAIHEQKRGMNNEAAIMALFKKHGVSEKDFKRVFRSFAVEAKLRRAKDMGKRYGLSGVPAIIVNGKYRTDGQEAGSTAKIFRVVNDLIKQESR